jgi:hypothetical protein
MSECDTVLAVNDDGLPSICGWEPLIENALLESAVKPQYLPESRTDFGRVRSAAAIALHMHQPLIPAGGRELHTAEIISNLKYMLDHRDIGDNHNAPVLVEGIDADACAGS